MDNNFSLLLDQARQPEIISGFSNVLMWGAGSYIEQALSCFEEKRVSAIYDNDPQKWGSRIRGVEVFPPQEFAADDNTAIIISAAKYMDDITKNLCTDYHVAENQLFPLIIPNTLKRHYLPAVIRAHYAELEQVWSLLEDEESKQYFSGYVNTILTMNPIHLIRNSRIVESYIYQGKKEVIVPQPGDCIVDCGAYIGDTMERFIQLTGSDCKLYGLEPVSGNYDVLLQTIQKYPDITPVAVQCAVGDRVGSVEIVSDSKVTMWADIFGTYEQKADAIKETVPIETLDHLFDQQKVDYIKMDIEGEEVNALLGAEVVIKRDIPTMMLSAYHMINHLWEIPLLVHKINPAYRIYCGHQPTVAFEPEFYCIAR